MMTNNTDYNRAANAYGIAYGQGMTKMQVLLELYLGLARFIGKMAQALADKDIEKATHYQQRAVALLIALQGTLSPTEGEHRKRIADVNTFYNALYAQIRHALQHEDPQSILSKARRSVMDVHAHWAGLYQKHPELFNGTSANDMA